MNYAILAVLLLILAAILYSFVKISTLFRQFKTFITPESEGQPSQLANVAQATADMIGKSMTASIAATFMQKRGVTNRNERSIKGDIAIDGISMENPLIGALLQNFPTLTKRLQKNPALLDFALSKLTQGGSKAPAESGHSNGKVDFNL